MKFTYYIAASLDGFIGRANGSVDWLEPFHQNGDDYAGGVVRITYRIKS